MQLCNNLAFGCSLYSLIESCLEVYLFLVFFLFLMHNIAAINTITTITTKQPITTEIMMTILSLPLSSASPSPNKKYPSKFGRSFQ